MRTSRTQDDEHTRQTMAAATPVDAALIAFLRHGGFQSLLNGDRGGQQAAMAAAIATWIGRGAVAEACELDQARVRRMLPPLPAITWTGQARTV